MFFQEITIDVVVFEELDGLQEFITLPGQPGQLTAKNKVYVVVNAKREGFPKERSALVREAP